MVDRWSEPYEEHRDGSRGRDERRWSKEEEWGKEAWKGGDGKGWRDGKSKKGKEEGKGPGVSGRELIAKAEHWKGEREGSVGGKGSKEAREAAPGKGPPPSAPEGSRRPPSPRLRVSTECYVQQVQGLEQLCAREISAIEEKIGYSSYTAEERKNLACHNFFIAAKSMISEFVTNFLNRFHIDEVEPVNLVIE